MTAKILDFARRVNKVVIEQRLADGFINATAMCIAHEREISDWLVLDSTYKLVTALANRLQVDPNSGISPNSLKLLGFQALIQLLFWLKEVLQSSVGVHGFIIN